MPAVYPFRAVTFASLKDQSAVVAPPYDVLDAAGKARLLGRDGRNIVGVDLPHVPAKVLGPAEAYAGAGRRWREMLSDGTLARSERPAMFAYRQMFVGQDGREKISRSGMACVVDTVPMGPRDGGGILPHEETFSGPKEDRLALMRSTNAQLSPVFGLHADEQGGVGRESGAAARVLEGVMGARRPDRTATTEDGTLHEVWTVGDGQTIFAYEKALAGEDVYIADGHHRYTTALNYSREVMAARGGSIGHDHPSRKALVVLVSMADPGLEIRPTHRVLGGMKGYSFEAFARAARGVLAIRPAPGGLLDLEKEMNSMTMPPAPLPRNVLGLYDFQTRRAYTANLTHADPLGKRFAGKPRAWRELDVAIVQHAIVDDVCRPALNGGEAVEWAFPHTLEGIAELGAGAGDAGGEGGEGGFEAQLAVVVRPTPLSAVREICRAGVLMPQKSTFFYPKLATGLFMHAME